MLVKALASLGGKAIDVCTSFGRAGWMLFHALVGKPEPRKQWPLLVNSSTIWEHNLCQLLWFLDYLSAWYWVYKAI
ncbi:hypothetical protein Rin_00006590 [Candidatus Regiella insecticola 5.15]|uniref:Uncharacterized protein n=1 Tax=Candidatus Regiella insecticola 5.15 TaxID=1005043 RepID=G2GY10_9ENTR|nr:hypothetical protein Rin_00006590 [Candidatus Regiella insecticola 5.15]